MTVLEEITKMLMKSYDKGVADTKKAAEEAIISAVDFAIKQEREACARVCEQFEEDMGHGIPQQCANAIRARGEK